MLSFVVKKHPTFFVTTGGSSLQLCRFEHNHFHVTSAGTRRAPSISVGTASDGGLLFINVTSCSLRHMSVNQLACQLTCSGRDCLLMVAAGNNAPVQQSTSVGCRTENCRIFQGVGRWSREHGVGTPFFAFLVSVAQMSMISVLAGDRRSFSARVWATMMMMAKNVMCSISCGWRSTWY